MRGFAGESHLDVWYDRLNASELVEHFGGRLGRRGRIVFAKPFAKARRKTSLRAVKKLTERVHGELRFRSVPPLLVPLRELFDAGRRPQARPTSSGSCSDEYAASLDEDRRYLFGTYRFVDMARKVVGVGSVGTRAWVFLFVGRGGKDPLVLQAKEAQASVLEPHLGASEFDNHGERVVRGQRISHAAIDIFLGWQRSHGPRRPGARLLRPPALGLEGVHRPLNDERVGPARVHARLRMVPGPCARPLRRPPRDRRVPGRRLEASTRRSPASRPPTPTRTSSTTSDWRRPSPRARSLPRPASKPARAHDRKRTPTASTSASAIMPGCSRTQGARRHGSRRGLRTRAADHDRGQHGDADGARPLSPEPGSGLGLAGKGE